VSRTTFAVLLAVGLVAGVWWARRVDAPPPPVTSAVTTTAPVASTRVPPTPPAPEPEDVVLPTPPFGEYRSPNLEPAPAPDIRLVPVGTQRRDAVESDEAWLARHGLVIADVADPVARALVPAELHDVALTGLFRAPPGLVAVYGGRYLRLSQAGTSLVLDLSAYLHSPFDRPNYMRDAFSDADYADLIAQKVGWAVRRGPVLYFDNHHETYAADSRNHTAFLSAFDLDRRELQWRTPPLVARARNFVVLGDVIVSGYGMTREPDFIFLIDAASGTVLQRLSLPSAPGLIATKGDRLHVACYDAEAEYRITR